jgi:hypothetical protein
VLANGGRLHLGRAVCRLGQRRDLDLPDLAALEDSGQAAV